MATKQEKKENIRREIIDAAKIYSQDLAGKAFLYVYGEEYFEILFKTNRFTHLTGVNSNLSAGQVYHYAKEGILTTNQFFFDQQHPYANARKKLSCLKRLTELTTNMVCVLKNMQTVTVTYKIGLTNLEFTLGLTENVDKQGNKIDNFFFPMTLRVNDKSVDRSADGEIVDFIFMRDASKSIYTDLIVADADKTIPHSVAHLIDSKIYEE